MGSKVSRASKLGSNPTFSLSYYKSSFLPSLVLHSLICQKEKARKLRMKMKPAFHVTSIQEMAVSAYVRTHPSALWGMGLMGIWKGRPEAQ